MSKAKKSKKRSKTTHSRISEESATSRVPQWLEKNDLHQPSRSSQPQPFNKNSSRQLFNNNNNDLFDDGDELDEEEYLGDGEK
jgi:hypothetical protein